MKKEKVIDRIFFCFIILGTWMNFIILIEEEDTLGVGLFSLINQKPEGWLFALKIALMAFLLQITFCGVPLLAYIAYKLVKRKHKKDKMDKIDFENDTYYREIIPKYSVGVLSYVDDFAIGANDVAATLLALELKKCIRVNENGIEILSENIEMSTNEKYVFDCVKNNGEISILNFENLIKKDVAKSNLVESKITIWKIFKMFFSSIFGTIFSLILTFVSALVMVELLPSNWQEYIDPSKITGGVMLVIWGLPFLFCAIGLPLLIWIKFFIYSFVKIKDPIRRSREGKELNEKLEGLRKYINDYSSMQEKNKEALILWEEYLVYSVMLGINKKAAEDVLRFIKIDSKI